MTQAPPAADGVILLRTARLDEVQVRPQERLARVGAGVKWGAVQAAAGAHGLTGLAGSSSVVSVVGYTLGGGLSWFSRKYGWASEGVRAFDIVDAGMRLRRASEPVGRPSRFAGTRRRYELRKQDGERLFVTLRTLDKLLDGRVYPADFWACVKAADDAWESGELDAWIEWPAVTRTQDG